MISSKRPQFPTFLLFFSGHWRMAQTGLILVPLLLLSIVIPGKISQYANLLIKILNIWQCSGQGTGAWEYWSPEEYWAGVRKEKEGIGKNATESRSLHNRYPNTSTSTLKPRSPIFLSLTNWFSELLSQCRVDLQRSVTRSQKSRYLPQKNDLGGLNGQS